ncbi:hypothetical protein AMK29_19790 [Streptomyces sp. CB02261]|nr:hypothetical protein AMK29_19790 [Streptomyces sp. CB02261]
MASTATGRTSRLCQKTDSWFGLTGDGFRFDHLFVSTRHADRFLACGYHQEACLAGLSDNAVMTLRLVLQSTPGEQGQAPAAGAG